MNKYFFLVYISLLCTATQNFSCPCNSSTQSEQPFFEQNETPSQEHVDEIEEE